MLMLVAAAAFAGPITEPLGYAVDRIALAWDNPEGYTQGRLYVGSGERGAYDFHVEVSGGAAVVDLAGDGDWYFAVTAISPEGVESAFSDELHWPGSRPPAPSGLRRVIRITVEVER
jgi:hypothetical protein